MSEHKNNRRREKKKGETKVFDKIQKKRRVPIEKKKRGTDSVPPKDQGSA